MSRERYTERYKEFDIIYYTVLDKYHIKGPYIEGARNRDKHPEFPTYREAVEYIDELREEGRYIDEKR